MISKEQVEHIANLARMRLSPEEIDRLQTDLSRVIDYFEILKEASTNEANPMTHSIRVENVTRKDVAEKSAPELRKILVESAPQKKEDFVKVRQILGG